MKNVLKSSIARILFGGFMLMFIPSMLIGFIVNYVSLSTTKKAVFESYSNYTNLLLSQLDERLSKFESLATVLMVDDSLNYINYFPMEDNERIWTYVKTLKQLQVLSYSNEYNGEITVFLKNKSRLLSSRLGIAPLEEDDPVNQFDSSSPTNARWLVETTPSGLNMGNRLTYTINPSADKQDKNIFVRISINVESMQNFIQNLYIPGEGVGYLVDGNGSIIMGANPYRIDINDLNTQIGNTDRDFSYNSQGKRFWVISKQSGKTGLRLVMYFAEEKVTKPIYSIRVWLVAAISLSLFLAVLFSLMTYKNLLTPLYRLIDGMKKVSQGDLKARIAETEKEELGFLFHQFNSMAGQMDSLVNEVLAEKFKNQQAQLDFLQSQINPHFLYNCLYTVYHLINSDNKQAAIDMTLYLGDYFRFATHTNKETVTLKDEMDNIETYLNIQKMRYPDTLNCHISLDEQILKIPVPRLSIQPIVENAIIHGLEKAMRPGNIWITGRVEEDRTLLIVEDDGKGITEEKLNELNRGLSDSSLEGPGCGLFNTHRRIVLRYGEASGLSLMQRVPSGMRITITFQKEKEASRVQPADSGR